MPTIEQALSSSSGILSSKSGVQPGTYVTSQGVYAVTKTPQGLKTERVSSTGTVQPSPTIFSSGSIPTENENLQAIRETARQVEEQIPAKERSMFDDSLAISSKDGGFVISAVPNQGRITAAAEKELRKKIPTNAENVRIMSTAGGLEATYDVPGGVGLVSGRTTIESAKQDLERRVFESKFQKAMQQNAFNEASRIFDTMPAAGKAGAYVSTVLSGKGYELLGSVLPSSEKTSERVVKEHLGQLEGSGVFKSAHEYQDVGMGIKVKKGFLFGVEESKKSPVVAIESAALLGAGLTAVGATATGGAVLGSTVGRAGLGIAAGATLLTEGTSIYGDVKAGRYALAGGKALTLGGAVVAGVAGAKAEAAYIASRVPVLSAERARVIEQVGDKKLTASEIRTKIGGRTYDSQALTISSRRGNRISSISEILTGNKRGSGMSKALITAEDGENIWFVSKGRYVPKGGKPVDTGAVGKSTRLSSDLILSRGAFKGENLFGGFKSVESGSPKPPLEIGGGSSAVRLSSVTDSSLATEAARIQSMGLFKSGITKPVISSGSLVERAVEGYASPVVTKAPKTSSFVITRREEATPTAMTAFSNYARRQEPSIFSATIASQKAKNPGRTAPSIIDTSPIQKGSLGMNVKPETSVSGRYSTAQAVSLFQEVAQNRRATQRVVQGGGNVFGSKVYPGEDFPGLNVVSGFKNKKSRPSSWWYTTRTNPVVAWPSEIRKALIGRSKSGGERPMLDLL